MSVCMVEYQGRCDKKGLAVGHSPKVLEEYFDVVSKFSEVEIMAPKNILRSVDRRVSSGAKVLPYHIVMKQGNTIFERINNKFNMFKNISRALNNTKSDTVWFFNVEFYFWLYMAFHKKPSKRIVVTSFIGGYQGGSLNTLKQWIFEMAQKKIDLILASGSEFKYKNCDSLYIPDYAYSERKYGKYEKYNKKEYAVCLGTMGADKQLDQLVSAFNKNGYGLKLVGRFYDKNWFASLKKSAKENVEISDAYVDKDTYYQLLSEASFCILPYKADKYGIQTSGVLQEAMFLDTIPVAFGPVLKGSNVEGISIDSYDDLDESLFVWSYDDLLIRMRDKKNTVFEEEKIIEKYKEVFG